MTQFIDVARDMVNVLSNIKSNVRNIKTSLLNNNKVNNNKVPNVNETTYLKYVMDIAKHCFAEHDINTAREIVNITIRRLSESNNHNAGSLQHINITDYAKAVSNKIREPQQCAVFKAFVSTIIQQERTNNSNHIKKKRIHSKTLIKELLHKGVIHNTTPIYMKGTNHKFMLRMKNGNPLVSNSDRNYTQAEFKKQFLKRKVLGQTLYVKVNSEKITLRALFDRI